MDGNARHRLLALAAMASVGVLVLDRLVLTPMTEGYERQSERLAELREAVDKGRNLLDREDDLRARWATMRRLSLPAKQPAAEEQVLKAVARWAKDNRITLTGLSPQWRDHKPGFRTLDCRATGQGEFGAIAGFLYDLENEALALRIEQCELASRDESGRLLTLNLRFSALLLPAEDAK